jgi:Protein of unknown function (DUF4232)
MTRYGQIGWRLAAIVAFAGTAALAVILTRAPVRTDTILTSDGTCPTSWLQAWLGLGTSPAPGGVGRERYYTLEFTNVSHRACRLYGYPQVSAYTGLRPAVGQIGGAAIRDTAVRPRPVMLAPGATAHSVLQVAGGAEPGCARTTAVELRITLPRQGRSAFVAVHIPVCVARGKAPLSVQPIQARSGVPRSTMP